MGEISLYSCILLVLYGLTVNGLIHPLLLSLIVNIRTFGHVYYHVGNLTDSVFYAKVVYPLLKLAPEIYYKSWVGLLLAPIVTLFGYAIGVHLGVHYSAILFLLSLINVGLMVYRGLGYKK